MASKATRRRNRSRRATIISLPGGESVAAPVVVGQHKPKEDPTSTVIEARRRRMGDMADKVDLRSAMAGDDLGRAILKADVMRGPDGRPDATYNPGALWDAVSHMRRTVAAYDRACGAPSRHPKCLGILTPPDRMEATADSPPFDDRPQADRDRSAVSAYMTLQGWLGHCDAAARSRCLRAVVDDAGVSDLPGIVLALQCVVDGKAGRKMMWRGRGGR